MRSKSAAIGDVPEHWHVGPLRDVLDLITYGFTNPMPDADEGPWKLTAKDIVDGRIRYETARRTTETAYKTLLTDKSRPRVGDVLLTKDGSIGRVAVADRDGLCINQSVALLRPNARVLPRFLAFLLRSPFYQQRMEGDSDGSTIKHIYITRVDKMEIALPPVDEQAELLTILGALDDRIDLLRQTNATLESIAEALFKSWFIDFEPVRAKAEGREPEGMDAATAALFPAEFEESALGLIPKGWRHAPFGELLSNAIGGDWGSDAPSAECSLGAAIIRGTDMPDIRSGAYDRVPRRFLNPKKALKRTLHDGDLVIEVSGGSKIQPTGRSLYVTKAVVEKLGGAVVPTSFCRLLRPRDAETGLMLAMHLDAIYAEGKMWNYQVQSTGLSNFQTQHFLRAEAVIDAPRDVLHAFFDLVRPMIDKVARTPISELAALRDSLLPRLISGKLRLPEAQEQLEDALA